MKMFKFIIAFVFGVSLLSAQAATQYWDLNTLAGYQHGDGAWTTNAADLNWGVSPTAPRSTWTNGNSASFSGVGDFSRVIVDGSITGNIVTLDGNGYTLVVTNGGRLTLTNYNSPHSLGSGANASSNSVIIVGGSGITSIWEQTAVQSRMIIGSVGNMQNSLRVDGAGFSGSAQFISKDVVNLGNGNAQRLAVVNGGSLICGGLFPAYLGATGNRVSVSGGVGVVSTLNPGPITVGSGTAPWGATNNAIVVDGAGVEDSALLTNVTTTSIGTQPYDSANGISVLNGGRLAVSTSLNVGNVVGGVDNYVLVDHATFTNSGYYFIGNGSGAARNSLTITNGGRAFFSGGTASAIGGTGSISNTLSIVGGDGVVSFFYGNALNILGNYSTLLVDGKGVTGSAVMSNIGAVVVCSAGSSNSLVVTNGGQFYASGLSVGSGSYGQALVNNSAMTLGSVGITFVGNYNELRIGSNAVANMSGGPISLNGMSNTLTVIDGGRFKVTGAGTLRSNGSFNNLRVSGEGSLLDGSGNSYNVIYWASGVGQFGNQVIVENGGVLTNMLVRMHIQNSPAPVNSANSMVVTNGGRFYSSGAFSLGEGNAGSALICNNTAVLAGASSAWDNGNSAFETGYGSNHMVWIQDGLLTNVAALTIAGGNGGRMIVTNGARIFSTSGNVGTTFNNNLVHISGANSRWSLGGGSLSIGGAAITNNAVVIDRGATMDAVGTLTVAGAMNSLTLLGGTLGAASTTYTNGLYTLGDGVQAVTFKALGGSLAFNAGLVAPNNAFLTGVGNLSGGSVGVTLNTGATLAPGLGGSGALTIGGAGLTFQAGSTCQCEIVDLDLGPGVGWDLVTVTGQVVLAGGAGSQTLKLSSRGAAPAHFDAGRNYNIRLLSYGQQSGGNLAAMTLDASEFLASGTWSLTNMSSSLYLVYRGGAASATPDYTWNVPNRGNWSIDGNWQGGTAPGAGGGASTVLAFGDNGNPYASTNDRAGNFLLNQILFAGTSLTTNFIKGNQLVFTNAGAAMDYQTAGGGVFVISNTILASSNLEVGGNAFAGTLSLGGVMTNLGAFTKKGAYTLALSAANDFRGPLVVDSPDGTLRLDNVSGMNGSGPVTLTNGTVAVNQGAANFYFANRQHNRRGLAIGRGSVWTNWSSTENLQSGFSQGASNVSFTIDGASMYWNVRFHAFDNMSLNGTAVLTNGAFLKFTSPTYGGYVGYVSTNCSMTLTGPDTVFNASAGSFVVAYGPAAANVLRIDNGASMTNMNNLGIGGAGVAVSNSLIITNGGRLSLTGSITIGAQNASYNSFVLTGTNTVLTNVSLIYCGSSSASRNNSFTIDNGALAATVRMIVAEGGSSNQMTIKNSGKLIASIGYDQAIASTSPFEVSNTVWVTGTGSLWNMSGKLLQLAIGNSNLLNRLTIEDGGLVTNVTTLVVASGIGTSNNTVVVNGGILQAATLSWRNLLPNDVTLTGDGQMNLGGFILSNVNQRLLFNGGLLSVKNAVVSNTLEFVAGDGTQSATLNAVAGGTNIFSSGLVITNNAILGGSGLVLATSTVFGAVSPGLTGVGALTNNGPLTMISGASARFDVIANTGVGCDLLVVTNGALTLTGTLMPVLQTGFVPAKTDRFLIVTNQGPGTLTATGGFADGARATIYAPNLISRVGTFKVETGALGVVLTDYQVIRSNGSLIIVR